MSFDEEHMIQQQQQQQQQRRRRRREGEVVVGPDEDVVFSAPPTAVVLGCAAVDDSRRLFQRLWTDEDEIKLLQGFLDHNNKHNGHNSSSSSSSSSTSYHHDTALFYEQIKDSFQLGFNKNQLVEKLRRLKKKYRTAVARISSSSSSSSSSSGNGKDFFFKTPHDQASFEISRKIWGSEAPAPAPAPAPADDLKKPDLVEPKLATLSDRDEGDKVLDHGSWMNHKRSRPTTLVPSNNGGVEELLKELMMGCCNTSSSSSSSSSSSGELGFWGLFNFNPLGFNLFTSGGDVVVVEDKWRKQRVLELETYSKRVDLVQEQVKLALEELRSSINPSLSSPP